MTYDKAFKWLKALCVAMLAQAAVANDAANSIKSIEVSSVASDKQVVTITMDKPVALPASFAVNTPPRIAFDFINVSNQSGKSSLVVNSSAIKSINLAEGTGRTRLVLSLVRTATYETKAEGNKLQISVDAASVAATPAVNTSSQFSENKTLGTKESLKNVDFRRGKDGEGRVVVDMSNPNIGIDIRQQGKNLIVEFAKTAIPRNLERRMDVVDFGTAIQKIDTFTQGDSVKMVIEPKGQWEYSAYQTESKFTVEVRAVDEQARRMAQLEKPTYKGEKLSLNFQNVEVRTVLQVIAEFTGKNIITSDTVTGNLTLRLKDVPWDQALDIILQSKSLDKRENGNVMWVALRDELAAKEKQALEARQQIADLEPLRTESFQLKYQKAEEFKKLLTDEKQSMLTKRGSAVIDPRTNTLFIQDVPAKLEDIRNLIAKIDVAVRQVLIEARIVEASDNFGRNLGARISFGSKGTIGDNVITSGTNLEYVEAQKRREFVTGLSSTANNVALPAAGLNGFAAGTIAALIDSASGNLLGLELTAMEADGKGKIISSPRLVTSDQVEAVIEDGTEIPYQQATSSGATSVSFKKATLSLKVKPHITPDGNIIMDVKVNKDSRGRDTGAGPTIDTKQVSTQVLVENGGTVVIGGIFTQEIQDTVTKVPLFGDIPVLGNLFKNTKKLDEKKELLIFITPKILSQELSLR